MMTKQTNLNPALWLLGYRPGALLGFFRSRARDYRFKDCGIEFSVWLGEEHLGYVGTMREAIALALEAK